MTRRLFVVLVLTALAVLTGCGPVTSVSTGSEPADGPVPAEARASLECEHGVADHGAGNYDTGPETLGDDARDAMDRWVDEAYLLPWSHELTETRDDGERVLYTRQVHDRTVFAAVVGDGLSGQGRTGFGVVSWAMCDPSEFPAEVSDTSTVQVWEDAAGHRVPTDELESYAGPEHCDWQDLTFLTVEGEQFLGGPADPHLRAYLDGRWEAETQLPGDARDTGYQRAGRRLWLAADGSAAYVGEPAGPVERWPAMVEPVACA